ncbi:MAG: hypothetical protein Phog2KO_47360 [Phototrophicaceae bacterium]
MSVAVILAGHGSQISPETAGVVWRYVDALRQMGIADEITASFWKEQPEFSQVLKTVRADTLVIVPLFTSSGYFIQQIIPAEMGLDGAVTHQNGCTIYLTRTVGEHHRITEIVRQRILDVLQTENLSPKSTSVAIIGHGTPRSNTTQQTSRHQVKTLSDEGLVALIVEAYLDDEPNIPSIFQRTDNENIIAVPFFLAEGSHVSIDVPNALGINYGDYPAKVQKRTLFYTPPIGTDAVMLQLIIDLIQDCGIEVNSTDASVWSHFPQVGADTLLDKLEAEKSLTIGQLQITPESVRTINGTEEITLHTPTEIRAHLRENPFRPLASSKDLPCDWIVRVKNIHQIPAIIEMIYPGALADWSAQLKAQFLAESFLAVMQRQQGAFRTLRTIDFATQSHFVSSVCGRCIKHPSWHQKDTLSDSIACSTPCNLFLSTLKEASNDG